MNGLALITDMAYIKAGNKGYPKTKKIDQDEKE